jgi:S1-C subfamily serine protease
MIISRQSNEVLTQSVSPVPDHNRLGAMFVRGAEDDSPFVGRVLKDSPAERAGLKSGDVLLEINGVDFSKRSEDRGRHPASFFNKPAGTELTVKVEREGSTHEFSVKLQDLLP